MFLRLLFLGLLLPPTLIHAAVIETNEWDNLTKPLWTYGGRPVEIDGNTNTPSGGGALKFRYGPIGAQTESITGGIAGWNGSYPREYYAGHWIKWSSNWLWNPVGSKIDYLVAANGSDASQSNVMSFVWGDGTFTGGCRGGFATHVQRTWGSGTYSMPQIGNFSVCPNQWYWVEFHVKMNTPGQADGLFDFWINDTLIVSAVDMALAGPSQTGDWAYFSHSPEFGGGGFPTMVAEQNIWMDHTVISTTRIGMPGGAAPTGDTQAPSVPAGLSAQAASSSQINLSWAASTDNVGVTGYKIFRGGTQIATAAGTSYSDTGLAASTAYTYTVTAYDAAGNTSAQSSAASATTLAAAGTPGTVTNLSASASGATSVNLSFTQVNDGTGLPAKYAVRFSSSNQLWGGAPDVAQGTCASPLQGTAVSGSLSCSVLGLTAATQYQFQLVSYRGTLNQGATFGGLSNVASAATSAGTPVITCDANNDGTSNVVDVQLSVNQALGAASCAADINRDGMCNVVDVQRIVNAALGGACVVGQ